MANVTFTSIFLKGYSISFLMMHSLIDFALAVLHLFRFKVYGNLGISKVGFFDLSRTERFKAKVAIL